MTEPRPGRCWYCGEQTLLADDPPEHAIPDALGGTLKTNRVCRECNRRAGSEIDWPLQNDFLVATLATAYGVTTTRRGLRADAHIADEPDAVVDLTRGLKPTLRSRISFDGSELQISGASVEEIERLLAREVERRGLPADTTIKSGKLASRDAHSVTVGFEVDGVMWLRAFAKMALAILSLQLTDDWLDTRDGRLLRSWLCDVVPLNYDGSVAATAPCEPVQGEQMIALPPAHVVITSPAGGGRFGLSIGLFGVLYLRHTFDAVAQVPSTCWLLTQGVAAEGLDFHRFITEASTRWVEREQHATELKSSKDA